MSGWAEVSRISAGIVDGGLSVALNPGRSAYSLSPGWRYSLRPLAKVFKALSCCQVYLPFVRDTGQPFNMCWTVGHGLLQRGHLTSGLNLHRRKFRGVGSVSDPALSRNDSCPAGIPFWIRFQTLFWDSSSVMSVNLLWTVNSLSLSFQCLTRVSRWTLVHFRDRVLVVIVDMDSLVPRCGGEGERAPGTHCLRMCLIATEFLGDRVCTCTYVYWWRHKLAALMCHFVCSWCFVWVSFIMRCSLPTSSWIPRDKAQERRGCLHWVRLLRKRGLIFTNFR